VIVHELLKHVHIVAFHFGTVSSPTAFHALPNTPARSDCIALDQFQTSQRPAINVLVTFAAVVRDR
jgi:hypothetical protein